MPAPCSIRVFLVEPHPLVRNGLRANLEPVPGLRVIGDAAGGDEALARIERLRPDVVLLDLAVIESWSGTSLVRAVLHRSPGSRIIVLSALEDERSIEKALAAGAAGHLRKDAFREELLAAVSAASRGDIAGGPMGSWPRASARPPLTVREIEILQLVARGLGNADIASALRISEGTVKTHLRRIFLKVGASDRTEAAITALKQGTIRF